MREKNITEQALDCSFCGTSEGDVDFLVEGEGVYICDDCVNKANDMVKENLQNDFFDLTFNLQTPKDIKLATIYLTASTIAMNDDLNLMPEGDDSMDNSTKSQKFEDMAMKILKDNKRLDRDMTMARAVGGFGTGMVTP